MLRYLLRRVAGALIAILVISFLSYVALTFAPGDAAQSLIGENASAEQLTALRQELGLDRPILERYGQYVGRAVAHGDLGRSLVNGRGVADLLAERIPATILLTLAALAFATGLGIAIGALAAEHPGGHLDLALTGSAALGMALPSYWVALILMLVFALWLRWLPVYGWGTPAHLILPATALGLPTAALVARLIRASLLEVRAADFVRTAHAKGLHPRVIFLRHTLPNSLIGVITLLGLNLSHLLGGAFIIETIFAWPGLGRLTVQAIFDRDLPIVMGVTLVVAPLSVLLTIVVDLIHAALDPRIESASL